MSLSARKTSKRSHAHRPVSRLVARTVGNIVADASYEQPRVLLVVGGALMIPGLLPWNRPPHFNLKTDNMRTQEAHDVFAKSSRRDSGSCISLTTRLSFLGPISMGGSLEEAESPQSCHVHLRRKNAQPAAAPWRWPTASLAPNPSHPTRPPSSAPPAMLVSSTNARTPPPPPPQDRKGCSL